MDRTCANPHCQEPWDAYGIAHHEDMTEEEAHLFNLGKGCPHCHFGFPDRSLEEGMRIASRRPIFPFDVEGEEGVEALQQFLTTSLDPGATDDPDTFLAGLVADPPRYSRTPLQDALEREKQAH